MQQPPCEDLDPHVGCVYKYFHQCISIPVSTGGLIASPKDYSDILVYIGQIRTFYTVSHHLITCSKHRTDIQSLNYFPIDGQTPLHKSPETGKLEPLESKRRYGQTSH